MDDSKAESVSSRPQPADYHDGPLDIDLEEILDWDFSIDLPLDRNVEIVEAEVIDLGPEVPLPVEDPSLGLPP